MLERRWSIIQRVTDVLVNRFELSAGIHNLGRTFHVGSFKLCYNVNRALFKELRMFYGFPPSTKTQTRHVQAVTRAFSIARVSLSREQISQSLDPGVTRQPGKSLLDRPCSGWNAKACAFCVPQTI